MTSSRDPDRLIHQFLLEGEEHLQDQVFDVVRASIEHKRQRVLVGPWRTPIMNKLVPIGLGATAVVVALVVATQLLPVPAPGGVGAAPSVQPSAMPPPLTQTFTSRMHGISVSYPKGWTARAATEPWTGTSGLELIPTDPSADVLIDPLNEDLFLLLGSQPIGSSTPDEWVAETMRTDHCSATKPIAVDGATGRIGAKVCATMVAVTTAGRGYWIRLYTPTSNEGSAFAPYDQAWFDKVLATVQLKPEDAVDVAPSATP